MDKKEALDVVPAKKSAVWRSIQYAGVFIGAVIGAGFASGQEVLQFFASYGYWGIVGSVLVMILFAWYGTAIIKLGHKLKINNHGDMLAYLFGKKIGKVFEWILTFFLFWCLGLMISGAGSSINEFFGTSKEIGIIVIAIVTAITVILGFKKALSAFGIISPIIIIAAIAISLFAIFSSPGAIAQAGTQFGSLTGSQATPFWLLSAVIYVSYCTFPSSAVLLSCGYVEEEPKVFKRGGILGGFGLGIAALLMILALFTKVSDIVNYQIPMLYIAKSYSMILGGIYTIIILFAIYTTTVPALYAIAINFAKENTKKHRLITLCVGFAACFVGLFPFNRLVGTVYPLLGYVGIAVMIAFVYQQWFKKEI